MFGIIQAQFYSCSFFGKTLMFNFQFLLLTVFIEIYTICLNIKAVALERIIPSIKMGYLEDF